MDHRASMCCFQTFQSPIQFDVDSATQAPFIETLKHLDDDEAILDFNAKSKRSRKEEAKKQRRNRTTFTTQVEVSKSQESRFTDINCTSWSRHLKSVTIPMCMLASSSPTRSNWRRCEFRRAKWRRQERMETASLNELSSMRSSTGNLITPWPWVSTTSEDFATAAALGYPPFDPTKYGATTIQSSLLGQTNISTASATNQSTFTSISTNVSLIGNQLSAQLTQDGHLAPSNRLTNPASPNSTTTVANNQRPVATSVDTPTNSTNYLSSYFPPPLSATTAVNSTSLATNAIVTDPSMHYYNSLQTNPFASQFNSNLYLNQQQFGGLTAGTIPNQHEHQGQQPHLMMTAQHQDSADNYKSDLLSGRIEELLCGTDKEYQLHGSTMKTSATSNRCSY